MENKNVALIACTNGYGHIRRLLILSQALKECGLTPVLFVPLLPTKIIAKKEGIVIPEIVDFDTFTKKENWLNGTAVDWLKFAPSFSDFDIVISDNNKVFSMIIFLILISIFNAIIIVYHY